MLLLDLRCQTKSNLEISAPTLTYGEFLSTRTTFLDTGAHTEIARNREKLLHSDSMTNLVPEDGTFDETFMQSGGLSSPSVAGVPSSCLILPPWTGDMMGTGRPTIFASGSGIGSDNNMMSLGDVQHL